MRHKYLSQILAVLIEEVFLKNMFLLSNIENISFRHLIMIIFLIIFLIYFLIKLLLEILNKHGVVTFTIGQDYAWYNWLSLVNILFSLAFIVSSYFIGSVDFFQFTISERILLGTVLLDVLLSFNIHNHLLEYRAYNLKEIKRIEYTTQRKHYAIQASYLLVIWLLVVLVFNIDLWFF